MVSLGAQRESEDLRASLATLRQQMADATAAADAASDYVEEKQSYTVSALGRISDVLMASVERTRDLRRHQAAIFYPHLSTSISEDVSFTEAAAIRKQ